MKKKIIRLNIAWFIRERMFSQNMNKKQIEIDVISFNIWQISMHRRSIAKISDLVWWLTISSNLFYNAKSIRIINHKCAQILCAWSEEKNWKWFDSTNIALLFVNIKRKEIEKRKIYINTIGMETVWRFRLMLFMAFTIIIFGDLLVYGNGEKNTKSNSQTQLEEERQKPDLNDYGEQIFFFLLFWIFLVCCVLCYCFCSFKNTLLEFSRVYSVDYQINWKW